MNRADLNPFEYFALHSLTKRRPLFRWEEDAVTPEVMQCLLHKGLVESADGHWVLTRLGTAALKTTVSIPQAPLLPKTRLQLTESANAEPSFLSVRRPGT